MRDDRGPSPVAIDGGELHDVDHQAGEGWCFPLSCRRADSTLRGRCGRASRELTEGCGRAAGELNSPVKAAFTAKAGVALLAALRGLTAPGLSLLDVASAKAPPRRGAGPGPASGRTRRPSGLPARPPRRPVLPSLWSRPHRPNRATLCPRRTGPPRGSLVVLPGVLLRANALSGSLTLPGVSLGACKSRLQLCYIRLTP